MSAQSVGLRQAPGARAILVTASIAAIVTGLLFPAAPARAADPAPIQLSGDGAVWSTTLAGGLFDEFRGAVPGDIVSATVWVHNPLDQAATLTVRAVNVWGSAPDLGESVIVNGAVGGLSLPSPVALSALGDCSTLAPRSIVGAGGNARVTITLTMLDVAARVAQGRTGGFDVLFTVTQGSRAAGANACDRARGGALFSLPTEASGAGPTTASPEASTPAPVFGGLPFTGADAAVPLAVGGFLVGLGLLLLFARRRKREPRE